MANQMKPAFVIALALIMAATASAQMSATYYAKTCPSAVATIRAGVISAVGQEARMGASLLRLHFHDCFVNGCDGSVLLDGGEKSAPANVGSLRGFDVIDTIKADLESACPGVVSCADILAVAARESVVALGGPSWNVLMGRRDSATAGTVGEDNLVSPSADLSKIISSFGKKGFSANEMVALYGAHTIGQAQCIKFRARIYNETNIDPAFALAAQANCPFEGGDTSLSPLDTISPIKFDNGWFRDLIAKKGLLHSDQQLYSGGVTDKQVSAFARNEKTFKSSFANGMLKMSNLSPLVGSNGQIRANCRKAN